MSLVILSLLPDRLNVNGDAENARVLAMRARWSGVPAEVVTRPPRRPDLVVIGSGFDAELPATLSALRRFAGALFEWVETGVPVLAVGTGLESLCTRIRLGSHETLPGLGLIPAEAAPAPRRMNGDLIGRSSLGLLVGYENHDRMLRLADPGEALADVVHGAGNGDGSEGVVHGSIVGTHLHGPVLAKNPFVADYLLSAATGGGYRPSGERIEAVDALARAVRERAIRRIGTGRLARTA